MQIETRFGKVLTREFATSLQRSHSVLLKDNNMLDILFKWLHHLKIKNLDDVKPVGLKAKFRQIQFETEVKFYVNHEVPMIVFHNISPLQGNFSEGVKRYMNLLSEAMFEPKDEWHYG